MFFIDDKMNNFILKINFFMPIYEKNKQIFCTQSV